MPQEWTDCESPSGPMPVELSQFLATLLTQEEFRTVYSVAWVAQAYETYGVEELTAEFTAAYLNAVAGLEPAVIENNAAYIQSWKDTIKADPKLVITAAGAAQKAADLILGTAIKTEAVEDGAVEQEQVAA